jgi:DnaJ-class molecular chaperone
MPRQGSQDRRGDLYVRVEVSLPQRLSERETALFRELAGQRRKASESE